MLSITPCVATVPSFCVFQVYFLKLNLQSGFVTFGVLGSTGRSQQLGWVPSQWGGNGTRCVFDCTGKVCQTHRISAILASTTNVLQTSHMHSFFTQLVSPRPHFHFGHAQVISAAILSIITVALSIIGLGTRKAAVMATLTSVLNFLCVFIAFVVDIVLFSILKARFLDPPEQERSTSYGPALWIALVSVVIAGVAVYSTAITAFGRSRYPRKWQREETY